ncbi:MAG: glycine cleavage T C-terminal barrel domain-containing protein [Chloroflexota bacterium]
MTSGAFSPTLEAGIGMAYLPTPLAVVGTQLTIDIRGRAVPAEVVARPFYQRPS